MTVNWIFACIPDIFLQFHCPMSDNSTTMWLAILLSDSWQFHHPVTIIDLTHFQIYNFITHMNSLIALQSTQLSSYIRRFYYMNSPQKDTVKGGSIKTLTSLPHIYAIVLMGLFTFIFLSVESVSYTHLTLPTILRV